MPTWNPSLYLQFADERTQPAIDLVAQIELVNPARIIDLGCGPGNSTAILRARWPQADIIGLDSSTEMIAAASKNFPAGKWVLDDIAAWAGCSAPGATPAETPAQTFDIVFSNAVFQWLPAHDVLFPRLFDRVTPGGVLAAQMPAHFESPLHRLIHQISEHADWNDGMDRARSAIAVHRPGFYYDLLQSKASSTALWHTEYQHVMENPEAILAWIRGTGLRPFLQALESVEQQQRFEQLLLAGIQKAYPAQSDGRVLFPFRRLFLLARRKPHTPDQ